jgi:hypothetical protein
LRFFRLHPVTQIKQNETKPRRAIHAAAKNGRILEMGERQKVEIPVHITVEHPPMIQSEAEKFIAKLQRDGYRADGDREYLIQATDILPHSTAEADSEEEAWEFAELLINEGRPFKIERTVRMAKD